MSYSTYLGGSGLDYAPTGDAFIAKLAPADAPAVALFPQTPTFSNRATGFTSPAQTVTSLNSGSALLSLPRIVANGLTGKATFSCAGPPQETTCTFTPESVTLGGTNSAAVGIKVQTTQRSAAPPPLRPRSPLPWLLGLTFFVALARRARMARRRVPALAALATAIILCVLFLASCGEDHYYHIRGTHRVRKASRQAPRPARLANISSSTSP